MSVLRLTPELVVKTFFVGHLAPEFFCIVFGPHDHRRLTLQKFTPRINTYKCGTMALNEYRMSIP